jgi:hypothetical protein
MTKADLVQKMKQYPDNAVLYAFNGDEEEAMPITGFLYDSEAEPPTLEFMTDENP